MNKTGRIFRRTGAVLLTTFLGTTMLSPISQAAGLMTPANNTLGELSIRQHHVDVVIEDGYAITTVDQVFFNPHSQALEAIYSFPIPEKAAVGEFTYWIDGKAVTGEVMKREEARALYEEEKAQGRETALTEQDEYKSFDSSVYPVLPNDEVKIRMVYIQPVHTDLGIGRYVYPLEEGGVDERKLNFWNYNETVEEAFSFNLNMRSSYPIDDFRLPEHPQAAVNKTSDKQWQVSFSNQAALDEESAQPQAANSSYQLDKDIVVYWRHAQGLPGAIDMVTYRPEDSKRGTFLLTVTPGDDLGELNGGRDWIFVLDHSGSMQGKYQSLLEGVRQGLGKLSPTDRFRIVLFNNGSREITQGYMPVNSRNVDHYINKLENMRPSGGTNLYAGLEHGYKKLDADRPSAILLVTDGVANVGITEKKDFLKLLEKHDVRLHSFVMGNSANRPLLEGMSKVSNGFATNVSNSDDIVGLIMQTADRLNHEAYRDIEVKIDGVKVKDITPAHIGSLYRGQQLMLMGHYWGDGNAEVTIKGKVSGDKKHYRSALHFPQKNTLNPELERLWAYASIEGLQNRIDYLGADADSEQALIDIALAHGLVTDYTSLVVVADEVFNDKGIARNNKERVEREQAARKQRAAQPVRSHRQDSAQPAFGQPRAYPSKGGGSTGPLSVFALLPLLLLALRKSPVR